MEAMKQIYLTLIMPFCSVNSEIGVISLLDSPSVCDLKIRHKEGINTLCVLYLALEKEKSKAKIKFTLIILCGVSLKLTELLVLFKVQKELSWLCVALLAAKGAMCS